MTRALFRWIAGLIAAACLSSAASAQADEPARGVLLRAAEAMGGLERLQALDNFVFTGFGQRIYYQGGGNITGDRKAPPKWQSVVDAQRTFDLKGERAVYQERWAQDFPFAGFFDFFTRARPAAACAWRPAGEVSTPTSSSVMSSTLPCASMLCSRPFLP